MKTGEHIRYVNGEAVAVPSHGGAKARGWRRQVALAGKAGNKAPAPPMKTLVFPLQAQIPMDWYEVSAAHYATIEGMGTGSLYQLLMRVHLAGLRPHGSEFDAAAARHEERFPNAAFQAAVVTTFGEAAARVTPQFLLTQFRRKPRDNKKKGKVPVFDVDAVANWLHAGCFGRSMSDDTDEGVRRLLSIVAGVVVQSVTGYADLSDQAQTVLDGVGQALKRHSPAFPTLRVDLPHDEEASPLAYTGEVRPVEADETPQYWLHHVVACLLLADPRRTAADVQNLVLSPSNNALSQLFNKMIAADGPLRQCDADALRRELGMPEDRLPQVRELMEAARSVPSPQMFAERHYADYRPNFGGRIRSWIANYLKRLEALRSQLADLAAATASDAPQPTNDLHQILDGLGLDWRELQGLLGQMARVVGKARVCVEVLKGLDETMRPVAAARSLEECLREIGHTRGICQQVANQLQQRQESNADATRDRWIAFLERLGSGVFALPGVCWGADDAQSDLAQVNQQLHRLLDAVQAIRGLAAPDGRVEMVAYLQQLRDDEASRNRMMSSADSGRSIDYADLARRRFLQSLVGLAQRLSAQPAERVWDWLRSLIQDSPGGRAVAADKVFNRLRFNQQGRIYVSPWSRSRHQAVMIDVNRFAQRDWAQDIEALCATVAERLRNAPSAQALQDHIEVERFTAQMAVSGMRAPLERQALLARVDVAALELHPSLAAVLQAPQIDRQTVSRLLALVDGHFSRLRFVLRRPAFVVRHKFSRIGQDKLLLVPKARQWMPPAKYFSARAPIADALCASSLFQPGQSVDAVAAFQDVAAQPQGLVAGALLKQIPHDLYVDLGLQHPVGVDVEAVVLSKDLQKHIGPALAPATQPDGGHRRPRWPLKRTRAVRLVGASSFTNRITDALIGRVLINEWTLVLDWVHESSVAMAEGRPILVAKLIECRPWIAVPITPQEEGQPPVTLFERFVAVDLGERQIGYAIFDVREALSTDQPLLPIIDPLTGERAVGAVRVPGVRRLIQSVKVHRRRQSGISKVRDRYDRRLQEMRDVVTGQVAHIIESLCARFNAFPVLESSVTNFQTGSRQLDLVYGNVVRLYTFSPDADAHNQRRAEHWMGADKWTHPYLRAWPFDKEGSGAGKKSAPLNLFPGASISPKGTSQRCIHCLRNPVDAFRRLEERSSKRRIEVEPGGIVRLDNGAVRLMRGANYPEPELKAARRDKRNLPLNDPLPPGGYESREVFAAIKRTMRQKSPSQLARDTTQSRYQCLYIDCGQSYHADAGAAINIGRKFFTDKIDRQASRAALASVVVQRRN